MGCGKTSDIKTDSVRLHSYEVEELATLPLEASDLYINVYNNKIVYNDSKQRLVMNEQSGDNEKEFIHLEDQKTICGICESTNHNLFVIAESVDGEKRQYEWIEMEATGNQKATGAFEDVSYSLLDVKKDNQNRWIALSGEGEVFVYNADGKFERKIETEGLAKSIEIAEDGQLLIVETMNDTDYIVQLDDALQNIESKIVLGNNVIQVDLLVGKDGKCYYYGEDYLYCVNMNENVVTPILCWIDEGINTDFICNIAVSEDGCVFLSFAEDEEYKIVKLLPIKKKKEEKKELVLACVGLNSTIREQILKYNNESDEYQISIRDYGEEDDSYQKLNVDIMTGKQFDILCMDGLYAQNYIKNGLLEDLSQYIEKDEFVKSYIQAIEKDGAIYQVSPYFFVQTIIGKKDDVGMNLCWTSDEMIDFLLKNQEKRGLLYYDESDFLNVFLWSGLDCFTKKEEQDYCFDKKELEKALKFINDYQKYAMKNEGNQDIDAADMIYRNELLLLDGTISSGNDYRYYKALFNSEITAKGYPNHNKSGNYMYLGMPMAICSKSRQKEAAWDFINAFFSDEVQYKLKDYGFPVKRKILNQLYDEWCKNDNELSMIIEGIEKKIPVMTKEDIDNLEKIIESASQLRVDAPELIEIIREESQLYFQKQQKIEDTILYIEKRVNTYFEEQK